jgi:hypothetical protein
VTATAEALTSIAASLDELTQAVYNNAPSDWQPLPAGSYLWCLRSDKERVPLEEAIAFRVVACKLAVMTATGRYVLVSDDWRLSTGGTTHTGRDSA